MIHDPLCPQPVQELSRPGLTVIAGTCHCATIAKVREDERANGTAEWMSNHGDRWEYEAGVSAGRAEALGIRVREVMPYANGYFDGENHMLAKCIAAVEKAFSLSLEPPWVGEVIEALQALQEKP